MIHRISLARWTQPVRRPRSGRDLGAASAGVGWLRRRGPPGKSKWPGPRGPGHSTLLRRSLRAASGTLQLRTSGQLDGVAGLDLDLFTGLRVATLASGTLGALNGEPAGDGELFALGHDIGEDIEDTIGHPRPASGSGRNSRQLLQRAHCGS